MNNSKLTRNLLRVLVLSTAGIALQPTTLLAQFGNGAPVPPAIKVPEGNYAYLKAGAVGTQNYICLTSGWTFVGPQATLFITLPWINGSVRQQIATHFLRPNPIENGTPRPAWQGSIDTSLVMAKPVASSTDPNYVDPTAIPWLLLEAVGAQTGPTGGSALSQTTFIQRVNTSGGIAPTTACTVGDRAFVPYTADYVFYRKPGS